MDTSQVQVITNEGPIFVTPCLDTVGMGVYTSNAHIHVFLTPAEVKSLVAALTGALRVVDGGVK